MSGIDQNIVLFFHSLNGQYRILDSVVVFFSEYFQYVLVFIVLVVLLRDFSKRRGNFSIIIKAFTAAIVARFGFTEIIRFLFVRQRPFVQLNLEPLVAHSQSASFPSGHATFFFAFSTIIYIKNRKLGIFCYIGSAIIGLARVYSGLHYITDIIGGGLVGILCAFLTNWFWTKYRRRPEVYPNNS